MAGCQAFLRNMDFPTFARIIYRRRTLVVQLDVKDEGVWEECFRVPGIDLPAGYYLGFSGKAFDQLPCSG